MSARARALVAQPGDVLLNSTGTGTIGRSCIFNAQGDFTVDSHVTVLRPTADLLDSRWLDLLLRSSWGQRHLETHCYSGSTNQIELSRTQLTLSRFPIPPLPEQRRIAEILDKVDEAIRKTEEVIAKLKQVKAGLLHDLLTRGIDEHGQLRDPIAHPEQFKDSLLGRIPREWRVSNIGDVAISGVDGPFGSNLKTEHYVDPPGVRVVRLQNIGTGFFNDTDKAFVSEQRAQLLSRHEVAPGDLIIASLGDDNHPIARACIYPDSLNPGIVKADCFRFRLDQTVAQHRYVSYVLTCGTTRTEINRLAQGVTRDRINLSTVRQIRFRLPPLAEQLRIIGAVESISAGQEAEVQYLQKLISVKSGLMNYLLTGQVRVDEIEWAVGALV